MAKAIHKLKAASVQKAMPNGMHADGGGLFLQVTGQGAKSWLFRYSFDGRRREMGLGSLLAVDLPAARARAADARRLILDGLDPIDTRRAARRQAAIARRRATTFGSAADAYFAAHGATWKTEKQREFWRRVMDTYAIPVLGARPVHEINTQAILEVLEPIWSTKTDTAVRVRDRVAHVLDWACARGLREGENPARWKGHLDKLLASPTKLRRRSHFAAMPYPALPAFMSELGRRRTRSRVALRFLILTGVRSGEARGARWPEIDLDRAIWTIPAERMKSARPHRIPLSSAALEILRAQEDGTNDGLVFPSPDTGAELSAYAFGALLRSMKRSNVTVHGFRSTFRDWIAEETTHANEVAEMALAHAVSSSVEAAYRRGDMFQRRRALMDDWAEYCTSQSIRNPEPQRRTEAPQSNKEIRDAHR